MAHIVYNGRTKYVIDGEETAKHRSERRPHRLKGALRKSGLCAPETPMGKPYQVRICRRKAALQP